MSNRKNKKKENKNMVTALPEDGPIITGRPGRHRYQVGDVVRFNCTSAKSKPAAMLSWFINGDPVSDLYILKTSTVTRCQKP